MVLIVDVVVCDQTGPNSSSEEYWGVNYRAINDLFQISQKRRELFTYEIGVQMIEIYNEQVRDLLVNDGSQKRYPLKHFCVMNVAIKHWLVN